MLGLMARAPISWLLIVPAIALTPFTAIPMYGLRVFCSWNVLDMLTGLLGGLWLIWLAWQRKERS